MQFVILKLFLEIDLNPGWGRGHHSQKLPSTSGFMFGSYHIWHFQDTFFPPWFMNFPDIILSVLSGTDPQKHNLHRGEKRFIVPVSSREPYLVTFQECMVYCLLTGFVTLKHEPPHVIK